MMKRTTEMRDGGLTCCDAGAKSPDGGVGMLNDRAKIRDEARKNGVEGAKTLIDEGVRADSADETAERAPF